MFVRLSTNLEGNKNKSSREAKWDVITDVRHPVVTSQRERLKGSGACPNPKKFKGTFLILEEFSCGTDAHDC